MRIKYCSVIAKKIVLKKLDVDVQEMAFIYSINSNGPNIDPCGTPQVTFYRF